MLVLRALNLGDLLVAVPALRALRRAFSDRRITLATPASLEPIVARIGAVDQLLDTPEPGALTWRGPPPDVVVNLHGAGPRSHRVLDALGASARIGFRSPDGGGGWSGPDWSSGDGLHERERWCFLLRHAGIPADPTDITLPAPPHPARGAPILVHPGARFGAKRWPADRFAQVAAALERPDHPVLITGSTGERPLTAEVAARAGLGTERVMAGRTGLGELADLTARAALVVSGDTGIAHLASAFATPSVVLFGPVGPERWGPPADGPHIALHHPALCRGHPFADDPDPALLAIDVGEVLHAAALAHHRGARQSASRSGLQPGSG